MAQYQATAHAPAQMAIPAANRMHSIQSVDSSTFSSAAAKENLEAIAQRNAEKFKSAVTSARNKMAAATPLPVAVAVTGGYTGIGANSSGTGMQRRHSSASTYQHAYNGHVYNAQQQQSLGVQGVPQNQVQREISVDQSMVWRREPPKFDVSIVKHSLETFTSTHRIVK